MLYRYAPVPPLTSVPLDRHPPLDSGSVFSAHAAVCVPFAQRALRDVAFPFQSSLNRREAVMGSRVCTLQTGTEVNDSPVGCQSRRPGTPQSAGGFKFDHTWPNLKTEEERRHVRYWKKPVKMSQSKHFCPQSSSAFGRYAPSGTFPPGEGIAPCGRCRPNGATNFNLERSDKLKFEHPTTQKRVRQHPFSY